MESLLVKVLLAAVGGTALFVGYLVVRVILYALFDQKKEARSDHTTAERTQTFATIRDYKGTLVSLAPPTSTGKAMSERWRKRDTLALIYAVAVLISVVTHLGPSASDQTNAAKVEVARPAIQVSANSGVQKNNVATASGTKDIKREFSQGIVESCVVEAQRNNPGYSATDIRRYCTCMSSQVSSLSVDELTVLMSNIEQKSNLPASLESRLSAFQIACSLR